MYLAQHTRMLFWRLAFNVHLFNRIFRQKDANNVLLDRNWIVGWQVLHRCSQRCEFFPLINYDGVRMRCCSIRVTDQLFLLLRHCDKIARRKFAIVTMRTKSNWFCSLSHVRRTMQDAWSEDTQWNEQRANAAFQRQRLSFNWSKLKLNEGIRPAVRRLCPSLERSPALSKQISREAARVRVLTEFEIARISNARRALHFDNTLRYKYCESVTTAVLYKTYLFNNL